MCAIIVYKRASLLLQHTLFVLVFPSPHMPHPPSLHLQEKAKLKVKVKLNLHSIVTLESVQQIDEVEVEEPAPADSPKDAAPAADAPMAEDGAAANGEVWVWLGGSLSSTQC